MNFTSDTNSSKLNHDPQWLFFRIQKYMTNMILLSTFRWDAMKCNVTKKMKRYDIPCSEKIII